MIAMLLSLLIAVGVVDDRDSRMTNDVETIERETGAMPLWRDVWCLVTCPEACTWRGDPR